MVRAHQLTFKLDFDWSNNVLDCEPNYKKRFISEMIHILSNDFTVNKVLYLKGNKT